MSVARPPLVVIGACLLLLLAGCRSAQDRVVLGDDLYLQGRYAQALEQYRRARRKDPAIPDLDTKIQRTRFRLCLQMGDRAVAGKRFGDARRAYEEAALLNPGHTDLEDRWSRLTEAEAEWHFRRGGEFLAAGDPHAAIPALERALEIAPGHAQARAVLERAVRERADRVARAETAYEEGLRARDMGRFEEAVEHFDRALELDPEHPGAAFERSAATARLVEWYLERGDESAERGAWAEALDHYEQARYRDPSSRRLRWRIRHVRRELEAQQWVERGDRARRRDDWREAYECYEQARLLTSVPQRVADRFDEARRTLVLELAMQARTAEQDGRFDEALAGYRAILDVHPAHPEAEGWYDGLTSRLQTAEAAYRDGRDALHAADLLAARRHFRRCTATLPGYLDAGERLAEVRHKLDLAGTLYDRALEAERSGRPQRARILYEECLAITRPFRDAEERAEETFAAARAGDGGYAPYRDACRAQARRDYERAKALLLTCRTEKPGYRDVADRLEQIGEALQRAAAAYRRAQEAAQRHELRRARDAYAECLEISRPYRDAADRLAAIEGSLALLREAERLERQRRPADALARYRKVLARHAAHPRAAERVRELDRQRAALEADYESMVEAEQQEDYRGALRLAVDIRRRRSGYRDVDERIAQLELEADYADARAFEEAERWGLASLAYERCVKRDAGFRDARQRWNRCREKVGQARGEGGRGPDDARGPGRGRGRGRGPRSAQGRVPDGP